MKRFKASPMDSGYENKKRRGIKEIASRYSTVIANKEKVLDKENSGISLAISPLSDHFSEKKGSPVGILVAGGEGTAEEEGRSVTCVSHGLISVIGRRREMEDAVTVAIGEIDSYDLFAVYDGHGGTRAANACREKLHLLIAKEVEEKGRVGGDGRGSRRLEYWENVMAACFMKMDTVVSRSGGGDDEDMTDAVRSVGSTAVVVMVGKEELVVANCGDSRAVLCRGSVAVPLSRDHKPDRPDEKERVEAAGGTIINWNGSRVLGVLATSRSIGDQCLKPFVISEPEVTVNERTELDDFLIIASDGLWDVLSNEFACEVVRRCLNGQLKMRFPEECSGSCAAVAATMLTDLALARGSKDNISVIVVELKKSSTIIC